MPGEAQRSENCERRSRRSRRRRIAIAALLLLALALALNASLPTAREKLTAIDVARAVADEDNAALIYAELLRGEEVPPSELETQLAPLMEALSDPALLQETRTISKKLVELEPPEELLDPNDKDFTLSRPWTSAEHPELRQWLDEHQSRIDRLLQAARKPACHFPLRPDPNDMGLFDVPLSAFRQNALLLRRAANNDMGEGNVTAGLMKYQALISMGHHCQMQPSPTVFLSGIACEVCGLHHLAEFIVADPATDQELDALVAEGGDLENRWESLCRDISHVRNVYSRTLEDRRPFRFRAYQWYWRIRYQDEDWTGQDRASELYHRVLCERRGHHILIELRRFKNRTGHWPDRLKQIASSLAPLALIDPQNGGAYVYQRTEDGFRLYSSGPNGQDENGQRQARGPDDWPIWPSYPVLARQKAIENRRKAQAEDAAAESMMKKLVEIYGERYQTPKE